MTKIHPPEHILRVLARLEAHGHEAWCVGGCVRDSILGRPPKDWDVATAALPQETAACFPGLKALDTGAAHGTVTLLTPEGPVEVTTFRVDGRYTGHRRPQRVRFSRDMTEDLARRDFTVNAMAWRPQRGILDPFSGQNDLEMGILRCVGGPARRFDEDALRILRAVRFAAELGFEIEPASLQAALDSLDLLQSLSGERVQSELTKLLCAPFAQESLDIYAPIILAALPELPALPELEDAPTEPALRWAALLRDCPPDTARALLTRLRFPNRYISRVTLLVRQLPLTPKSLPLSRRLELSGLTAPGLALSGGDLISMGCPPGPGLGRILDSLLAAVLSGELPNQWEALLTRAREIM